MVSILTELQRREICGPPSSKNSLGWVSNYYIKFWSFTFYYFQSQLSASPRILLSHELEMESSAWTIAPLIPLYVASGLKNTFIAAYPIPSLSPSSSLSPYLSSVFWVFFALEETDINFSQLQAVLDHYDPQQVKSLYCDFNSFSTAELSVIIFSLTGGVSRSLAS